MRYGERKTVLRDARERITAAEDAMLNQLADMMRRNTYWDAFLTPCADTTISVPSVAPIGPHVVVLTDHGAYVRS